MKCAPLMIVILFDAAWPRCPAEPALIRGHLPHRAGESRPRVEIIKSPRLFIYCQCDGGKSKTRRRALSIPPWESCSCNVGYLLHPL